MQILGKIISNSSNTKILSQPLNNGPQTCSGLRNRQIMHKFLHFRVDGGISF